ncbi:hypothetical protein [Lacrimispora sp. 210928-DFI.3.58]|uniref:hypothetical protein n=1 Tax=Lacrimispora sp. 210928-DFI.3.58 TaxID=2883214 RepID=UPI001D062C9E|nr:hypothetical protein [Lacrimispora sp. 210928-DFI.3.58]MCB7318370.1 hypothetical protein [Lacrimispora sp. 210928-DFI.3.58]
MTGQYNNRRNRIPILVLALALGLQGCAGGTTGSNRDAGQAEEAVETEESLSQEVPVLEKGQSEILKELSEALDQGRLKAAAEIMEKEQETLVSLIYETMDGQRYLWDGEMLKADIEGKGLVFIKPSCLFYGNFKDGRPEGRCEVLQTVNLDAPRYDYSQGLWEQGKMEGMGRTGYCYYEKAPAGEAESVCKSGMFSKDKMEGEITCESTGGEGSRFHMTVRAGVVELDDRWAYLEEEKEYQLLSKENKGHAYILSEEQAALDMWKNILVWEE